MNKNLLILTVAIGGFIGCNSPENDPKLIHVSYEATGELFRELNAVFSRQWELANPTKKIQFFMSHGGSGKQARAVIEGLPANLVSLSLPSDVDRIANETGLIPENWRDMYPHNASAWYSPVVFLVRKGNPGKIQDWDDLIRNGISVVTPNPKTSGGARWNYIAAYGYFRDRYKNNPKKALSLLRALYRNVVVMDSGTRSASATFTKRKLGHVLITWESEAYLAMKEMETEFEIVFPSKSVKAQLGIAFLAEKKKLNSQSNLAHEYITFLYSERAQLLAGKHYFRPVDKRVASKFPNFQKLQFLNVQTIMGNWEKFNSDHFSDGGIFDTFFQS